MLYCCPGVNNGAYDKRKKNHLSGEGNEIHQEDHEPSFRCVFSFHIFIKAI